jgi:hypothetical protein
MPTSGGGGRINPAGSSRPFTRTGGGPRTLEANGFNVGAANASNAALRTSARPVERGAVGYEG